MKGKVKNLCHSLFRMSGKLTLVKSNTPNTNIQMDYTDIDVDDGCRTVGGYDGTNKPL
jgi:hypothetical protein